MGLALYSVRSLYLQDHRPVLISVTAQCVHRQTSDCDAELIAFHLLIADQTLHHDAVR